MQGSKLKFDLEAVMVLKLHDKRLIRIGKQQPTKQSDFSNFQDSKVQQTSQEPNSQRLNPMCRDGHAHCSHLLSMIKDEMFSHTEHPVNKQ